MATPRVSVIIPTYNSAATLSRAITSVLLQNWLNLEIVVVDDGSTDDTVDKVQPYIPRIKYLRQANAGTALARNRGVDNSEGEYIAFLDADDEWLPGKLNQQIAALECDPAMALSSTGALVVDSTNTVVDIISASHQGDAFRHMLRWNLVVCSSVVLRRSAWLESGLRFEGSHSSMEDYSMWLGLAARCRFSISPNLLVRYHVTSSNKTSARTIDLYREHLLAVFEQLQRDEVFRSRLEVEGIKTDTSVRLSVAREHMERGCPGKARKELIGAVARDWHALTYRLFWNTLLWSSGLRYTLKKLRARVALRFYFPNGTREQRRGPQNA